MSKLKIPAKPGTYTLIMNLALPFRRGISRLGYRDFDSGLYTYIGSAIEAKGNLRNRVSHHL